MTFEDVYVAYAPRISARILYLVRDPHVAEDLTQEVFTRVWARWPLPHEENVAGYLYRVAHNLVINAVRHRTCIEMVSLGAMLGTSADEVQPEYPSENLALLAFQELSPEHQEICRLYALGLSGQERAARVGVANKHTVDSTLYRARQHFSRVYAQLQEDAA